MSSETVRSVRRAHAAIHGLAVLVVGGAWLGDASTLVGQADSRSQIELLVDEALDRWSYRNIGPFRAGSWITDIAGKDARTFYVAARNGGVWKTTNAGTTFTNVTDGLDLAAVGDIALAPSDPEVLWVGTGDAENARSSYSGTGVYASSDGGATWTHRGLEDSHHIARIVVHPQDPETVLVAVMGHLFSANAERGIFRTSDGGESWEHALDLGPDVGMIDLVMDPQQPRRLYAAAYEKQRLPWHFEAGGERSGIYRSDDGGATWNRLGGGLPTGKLGRIGIDLCRTRPRTLYAVVENLNPRQASSSESSAEEDAAGDPLGNQVYRSDDGGDSWRLVSPAGVQVGSKSAYAFNEVRVHPADPETLFITSETLISSVDGGATFRDLEWPPSHLFAQMFGDVRTLWINPSDPEHMLLGSDGGVFPTFDGGQTIDHLLNLPLGEVYRVAVDLAEPYNVYAGLQDHEAWRGPVNSWSGAVTLEDWVIVGRWDGMASAIDPQLEWYYGTTQFGNHLRANLRTGRREDIEPQASDGDEPYRFTWTTPLRVSVHDSQVIYTASQKVLRSSDRGDSWEEISPDLTTADPVRIAGKGYIEYCTVTTLSESRIDRQRLWAGTDDGKVWSTDDLGTTWHDHTAALLEAGAPLDRWVSRVVASGHDPQRAYVTKSGYRRDDFAPYVFVTDDGGRSWRSLSAGLPDAPISVIAEDLVDPELLFVGNDWGVFVSLDRGTTWRPLRGNMPRVPVRDLVIHPRDGDLVVGTYGRGLWIAPMHPLRELSSAASSRESFLFEVEPRPVEWTERNSWGDYHLYGDRQIEVPNEPSGLEIFYWQPADPTGRRASSVRLQRPGGALLASLDLSPEPGLHRVVWETREGDDDPVPEEATSERTGQSRPSSTEVRPGEVLVELVDISSEANGGDRSDEEADEVVLASRRTRLLPMPLRPVQP